MLHSYKRQVVTMFRRIMILVSSLLFATLALSVIAAPQSVAAQPQATAIAASLAPQQDDYTRGFRDGYRQGHDDGEVDGRLDCQTRHPRQTLSMVQNDYERGYANGYPQGYQLVTSATATTDRQSCKAGRAGLLVNHVNMVTISFAIIVDLSGRRS